MNDLNGKDINGTSIEVSLAKPPSDKKKKEEILRAREKRMMQMMQFRGIGYASYFTVLSFYKLPYFAASNQFIC